MVYDAARAIGLIGRLNPVKPGNSPFSAMANSTCVDPHGVVVTCCHALDNFFLKWSPVDISTRASQVIQVDDLARHERPFVSFLTPLDEPEDPELGVPGIGSSFPLLSLIGDRTLDIAVLELGGRGKHRPLTFVPIAHRRAANGEEVVVAGQFGAPEAPLDLEGNCLGFGFATRTGKVRARTPHGFLVDLPVPKGMSGSGVRDGSGALLGVITELWPAALSAHRVGIDAPLSLAIDALQVIPYVTQLRTAAMAREAAGGIPWCSTPPQSRASA